MEDPQHPDSDAHALASALGAITSPQPTHHFHHQLQAPDFSQSHGTSPIGVGVHDDIGDVDVGDLDIPTQEEMEGMGDMEEMEEGDLDLGMMGTPGEMDMEGGRGSYGRPPSIRKACDLCHAAKQKCSGDRPSCTRCTAGGWTCVYAPRQRRRTVPKELKQHQHQHMPVESHQSPTYNLTNYSAPPPPAAKKRKLGPRESVAPFGGEELKAAMGMAVDLGLANEEEGEDVTTMSDEAMLESIAIDGYLADLPLATFVHNLPYTAGPTSNDNHVNYNADDFPSNTFPSTEMDPHATSALRDAIFSLNESSGGREGGGDDGHGEGHGEGGDGLDPHLALLDLSHAMPGEGDDERDNSNDNINLGFGQCSHTSLFPHILSLLTAHPLEPKPGSNTPLTLGVFAPIARSLRLFHASASCPACSGSPQQTLPQLALLSRTTTILTFPFPPIKSAPGASSAQITINGARLAGTGLSEAIEQHIVGVVWDSWRAAIREIFANLERKAQDVITTSAGLGGNDDEEEDDANGGEGETGGDKGNNGKGADGKPKKKRTPPPPASSAETQRAGLMFQAMSRLVTAMDEVEGN